jgi:hypothetical protein
MPEKLLRPEGTQTFREWYKDNGDVPLKSVPFGTGSDNHRYWIGKLQNEPIYMYVNLDPADRDFLISKVSYSWNHANNPSLAKILEEGSRSGARQG